MDNREHQKDCICAWCEVEKQNAEMREAKEKADDRLAGTPCSPSFSDKVADLLQDIRTERDRYKTALEGIAGFPHQYFDGETPWRMRKLAEHALSLENAQAMASADTQTTPKETAL